MAEDKSNNTATSELERAVQRTHILLIGICIAVTTLALSSTSYSSIDNAMAELQALDSLPFTNLAAFLERDQRSAPSVRDLIRANTGARVADGFAIHGAVVQTWPSRTTSVRDYISFLEGHGGLHRVSPLFTEDELSEAVAAFPDHSGHSSWTLQRIDLRCYAQRPDGLIEPLVGTAETNGTLIVQPLPSTFCRETYWYWSQTGRDLRVSTHILKLPMDGSQFDYGSNYGHVVPRWLGTLPPPYTTLYDPRSGQGLPSLRRFWTEVADLSIQAASHYLRQRQETARDVEVAGVTIRSEVAAVLAPAVTIFGALAFAAYLAAIVARRECSDAHRDTPCLVLLSGLEAQILAHTTLWIFPIAANVILVWRVSWQSPARIWAVVGLVLLLAVEARLMSILAKIWWARRQGSTGRGQGTQEESAAVEIRNRIEDDR